MMAAPALMPVTTPVPAIDAAELVQLQVPPAEVDDKVAVLPAHTVVPPLIVPAVGAGFTVTEVIALAVPQPLVTV